MAATNHNNAGIFSTPNRHRETLPLASFHNIFAQQAANALCTLANNGQ
jgi:hypothetical protein